MYIYKVICELKLASLNVFKSLKNVFLHIVDMSQPRQVYKFAKEFAESQKPLNVLVNNAGCMINERQTVEGLEANFSTNTLGTHILTKTLIPVLEKAEKPRVVIL